MTANYYPQLADLLLFVGRVAMLIRSDACLADGATKAGSVRITYLADAIHNLEFIGKALAGGDAAVIAKVCDREIEALAECQRLYPGKEDDLAVLQLGIDAYLAIRAQAAPSVV